MKNFLNCVVLLIVVWYSITSLICNIMNPNLTKMQVFLRTPQSIVLDFGE